MTDVSFTDRPFAPPLEEQPRPVAQPFMGIDPGIRGGIAFFWPGVIDAYELPVVAGELDVHALAKRIRANNPRFAVIERVGAFPGQGVSSTFKFGQAYGVLRAVTALCGVPYQLVHPTVWKKRFSLDRDKEKSRALALRLWPAQSGYFSLKKDEGKAEAALLAKFASEIERGA